MSPRGALGPDDCEILVARELRRAGIAASGFRRIRDGAVQPGDGWHYDIAGRLEAYGSRWSVLVECRNTQRAVTGPDIDDVRRRADAAGARSALVFATAGFDADAIRRAHELRIALLQIIEAQPALLAAGLVQPGPLPAWVPELTVTLVRSDASGLQHQLLEADQPELILRQLRREPGGTQVEGSPTQAASARHPML